MTGALGNAVRAPENVFGDLDVCGTVDGALKGRLEDVRDTLREVLSQAGGQTQTAGGAGPAFHQGAIFLRGRPVIGSPTEGAAGVSRGSHATKGWRARLLLRGS